MDFSRQCRIVHLICTVILVLVVSISAFAQVTAPEQHFGKKPGADFFLMPYEEAIGYFELIASQTDRMQMFDMGETSEGRRMKYAVISSEENMANLERLKEINKRLSLAHGLTDEEAKRLADEGKVVVWIDGGLHATEVAPAQHLPQLAYDLVAGEDRRSRSIRENVITLLVFANPDGMTMVSDWYNKNLGTPYEVSRMPWLYQKYAGHDNNRDSFIANLVETQNMNRAHSQEWYPEILFNQHQTAPFPARIWIPPDAEPTNPNVHPLIIRWKNHIGTAMGKAFDEANQPGAISRITFDSWFPGYCTQVVDGHNAASILTETALYRYATPHYYTINDFPEAHRDLTVGAFYPTPWEGGWWRLGDAVAYCWTASISVLDVAAKYRYDFLHDKYVMGRDGIEVFKHEPPYGWIFSPEQADPNTTALMLNRLLLNAVEVYTADEAFKYAGIPFPKGTYIIPSSQPFAMFAKNILEKQQYPDLRKYIHIWQALVSTVQWDGAPLRPYDGAGWTLPLQMGVDYLEMSTPVEVNMTQINEASAPAATVSGGGSQYAVSPTDNKSFTAINRIFEAGGKVSRARESFTLRGKQYPEGTFIVDGRSISSSKLREIASEIHVPMQGGSANVNMSPVDNPRIALYMSWTASADAGWITYIFDQFEFKFHKLRDAEVRAGSLRDRFDVIVLADERARSIVNGHRKGTIHPDYVGGITEDGVANLRKFVEDGGVLVCNNNSSDFAIEYLDIPVKNRLQGVPADSFSCPGSILQLDYDKAHPVAFGMKEQDVAFFSRGRVFEIVEDEDEVEEAETNSDEQAPVVVARYSEDMLLQSGWILGEDKLHGKPAVVDVPVEQGRIILFGFNFHNRAQAHATFKLLFNSIYYR